VRYGVNCYNCRITQGNKGFCKNCEQCGPDFQAISCSNSGNSYSKIIINESSCTNCTNLNGAVGCNICYDMTTTTRTGIKCTSCRMFNQTHGSCTSCSLCLPLIARATCDNSATSYRYLILDKDSCSNCTTISGSTTCAKCIDKNLNGNFGTNCRSCKQEIDGTAYCDACATCL
jgi:hypothetical protein